MTVSPSRGQQAGEVRWPKRMQRQAFRQLAYRGFVPVIRVRMSDDDSIYRQDLIHCRLKLDPGVSNVAIDRSFESRVGVLLRQIGIDKESRGRNRGEVLRSELA